MSLQRGFLRSSYVKLQGPSPLHFLHCSHDFYFVFPSPQAHWPFTTSSPLCALASQSSCLSRPFCSLNKPHMSNLCSCCAFSLECLPPTMSHLIFKVQFKYLLPCGAFLIFPGTLGPHAFLLVVTAVPCPSPQVHCELLG